MNTTQYLPSPKEIMALLAQSGVPSTDKEAFVKAFKNLYPSLSASERALLLADLLAYIDTVLESEILPAAA